jgi:hypothetical protein
MDFDPTYMPVNTHDFAVFFGDEDVRRHTLGIIQSIKSLKNCEEVLGPEEYMDWRDTIMAMVELFSDIYDTHGLPEMENLACQDENSNGNPLNQGFVANIINNNNNNNIPVQNIGSRFLPVNAENTITGNSVADGNLMVNFQNEFQHGRLYKRSTYNALQQKKNPYTSAPITALKQYTAVIGAPPLEGGRTRRRRRGHRRQTRRST